MELPSQGLEAFGQGFPGVPFRGGCAFSPLLPLARSIGKEARSEQARASTAPLPHLPLLFPWPEGEAAGEEDGWAHGSCMEWVDIQHRTLSGILTSVFWSLGNMLLALIAYLVRDWRWLLLAVTLPCAVGLVSTWWLSESARWLLANGRHKEAHRHLQRCANMNKRKEFAVVQASGRTYSYVTLFRTPMLRKISFCMGTVWFGAAFSYYGISMDITGFGLGMYMTQFVFGIIELPAKAIVFVTANRFGRRQSQAWSLILTGLCVGSVLFLLPGLGMLRSVVAIIGKGLSEASFTLVFLYTAELFPTVLRQNGQGYCSFMARLGGSVAPLVFLLDSLWKPLPQVMYCALAVLCGSTAFLLPETLDAELPETVEDVEKQR
uniref:Solute carrier family 22 member 7 n=1 Tax=Varanus komodoensis TaxID=61221 RepID=A0A8D2L7X0_VARKO